MKYLLRVLASFLMGLMLIPSLYAQTSQTFFDNNELLGFGGTVEISENEIHAGSRLMGNPRGEEPPGKVHTFQREADGTWVPGQVLLASDGIIGDQFGYALDRAGTTLAVSAPGQNEKAGVVYVFEKDDSGEWQETGRLSVDESQPQDQFGYQVAVSESFVFVAAARHNENTGIVYVFKKNDGVWALHSEITGSDPQEGDAFGSALASAGTRVVIGAPFENERKGGAYVFQYDASSGSWIQEAKLASEAGEELPGIGFSVAMTSSTIFVASPGLGRMSGAVLMFSLDETSWNQVGQLQLPSNQTGTGFGYTLAATKKALFVGAPRNRGGGVVYVYDAGDQPGSWERLHKIRPEMVGWSYGFSAGLAAHGATFVAGASRADYEEGNATIFEFQEERQRWVESKTLVGDIERISTRVGELVTCEEGEAYAFPCKDVNLVSFISVDDISSARGVKMSDLWGWTDPQTKKEYVLAGRNDGTSFIDISDPSFPVFIGDLPKTEGSLGSVWRDIKVYKDHAYIVADGAGSHGMQVFDLRRLRDIDVDQMPVTFDTDAHYEEIHSAHNIVINEDTGFAYAVGSNSGGVTCGGGLHIINIQEPAAPEFAGCFSDPETGRAGTGYIHDAQCVTYRGPDADYQGKEICFSANETALAIADLTNKENPRAISQASYPNVSYAHQGWLTEDQKYFFANDETDEYNGLVDKTRTLLWDVQDLDDPILVKEIFLDSEAIDHNLYIRGNFMYQANYLSGLRILDITDIENPTEIGFFDTAPYGVDEPSFGGAWSSYPFFESNVIAVTSKSEGVFLVKKKEVDL